MSKIKSFFKETTFMFLGLIQIIFAFIFFVGVPAGLLGLTMIAFCKGKIIIGILLSLFTLFEFCGQIVLLNERERKANEDQTN